MKLMDRLSMKRDAAFRAVQLGGLSAGARLAATALREPLGESGMEDWQLTAFRALVETICEPGESGLPRPADIGAADAALEYIRWMPGVTSAKLGNLVATLEGGPLVLGPARTRFSRLEPEDRAAYLTKWSESSIPPMRAAFHAIKQVAMMGYYTRQQTWPFIGYSIRDNPGAPERIWEES